MPTISPANKWEPFPDDFETGFSPNHGQELTTEEIIAHMEEVAGRPEMRRLNETMMASPCYLKRKES